MTTPTTTSRPLTASARTSVAAAKIAATTGFSPAAVHAYLDRCVAVAEDAVAAGCDLETALEFVDRIPAPRPSANARSTRNNTMSAALPAHMFGRPYGSAYGLERPQRHPGPGNALMVFHPPARRNTPAHVPAPRAAKPLPVNVLVDVIRERLGPLPIHRR